MNGAPPPAPQPTPMRGVQTSVQVYMLVDSSDRNGLQHRLRACNDSRHMPHVRQVHEGFLNAALHARHSKAKRAEQRVAAGLETAGDLMCALMLFSSAHTLMVHSLVTHSLHVYAASFLRSMRAHTSPPSPTCWHMRKEAWGNQGLCLHPT